MKKFIVPFLIVLLAGVCFGDPNAVYRSSPPTLTSGDTSPLCVDSTGNLRTIAVPTSGSTNSLSRSTSLGTTHEANVKSSAGNIYAVYCWNANSASTSGGRRWLQIFNMSTIPSTETPIFSFSVGSSAEITIANNFFGANGYYCSSGISWGLSTQEAFYGNTEAVDTDEVISIMYK